jgi:hypothetical protein
MSIKTAQNSQRLAWMEAGAQLVGVGYDSAGPFFLLVLEA